MLFVKNYLTEDPDRFIEELKKLPDYLSEELAREMDRHDPLAYTQKMFRFGQVKPLAGHSLGPAFIPGLEAIEKTYKLQSDLLHGGHFQSSHPDGEESAHWFGCDRYKPALSGAKKLLGFQGETEFNFTAAGLSENLGMLLETFYHLTKKDWDKGRTKVCMLETEFFSDQAIASSVVGRAIISARDFDYFEGKTIPTSEEEIIKIPADERGLYNTSEIIRAIKENVAFIKVICLPGIVFNTGQRLALESIFSELRNIIKENQIKVILDLAHSVGNRPINLEALEVVTAAVGCGYKHLTGPAGEAFGIYVNRNVDLSAYPPIQGWTAADPAKVFQLINHYDSRIMVQQQGALAFKRSNPPPLSLLPVQAFIAVFNEIGFDKCFNKSECLTRYLLLQLQEQLGDQINFITPVDPNERGATIAIQLRGNVNVALIEEKLKDIGYEIDTRPPNIIRITAHYGYTTFSDICQFVKALDNVLSLNLREDNRKSHVKMNSQGGFLLPQLGIFSKKALENGNITHTLLP